MSGDRPNDGGAAFPASPLYEQSEAGVIRETMPPADGMSLRDWLAGQVATSLDHETVAKVAAKHGRPGVDILAEMAYQFADAMLAEREKPVAPQPNPLEGVLRELIDVADNFEPRMGATWRGRLAAARKALEAHS